MADARDHVEMVREFLRAQNLEQVDRTDDAIELYEGIIEAGFDSTGPYDRLITIYSHRAQHGRVVRVCEAALANVRTHADKRGWYEMMRGEAQKATARLPKAAPRPQS